MKKVEFLIIGQGLAGTMLAFEMLDAGMDFRIISSPHKSKASVVAAGMINPLVFKRMTKSWMVDELLPCMHETYRRLEDVLGSRFLFDKQILKPLSEQESELWKERKKNKDFAAYIDEISDVSPLENLQRAKAYGTINGSGYLNLVNFLTQAGNFFKQKGLLHETEYLPAKPGGKDSGFQIENIKAEKLVFAEGYHLVNNPLFDFVKLNPVKGEVVQIYAPDLSEQYILNKKCFVLPIGNKRFKVGSTYEWKTLHEQVSEKGRQSILERMENLVNVEYVVEEHWAGIRPAVIDRRPVLGQHPEAGKHFLFNGLGTKGVMLAPYFARLMCRFLQGKATIPSEINLNRFL